MPIATSSRARILVLSVAASFAACPAAGPDPAAPWKPGVAIPSPTARVRGLRDVKGLIHAHSHFSHDACDGEPVKDGVRDEACLDHFRSGLCDAKLDYVFLTDHKDSFAVTEFDDAVLFRAARGDVKLTRDGATLGNRAGCPDGTSTLILPGTEAGLMPVGLQHHVSADPAVRDAVYDNVLPSSAVALRDAGAVILLAHPEDYTAAELYDMNLDGFEMYNLHANALLGAGPALDMLLRNGDGDPGLLDPSLFLVALWSEDPRYLERWGRVLARGRHVVSTMGTDCHENTFPAVLADGERADSYRRMMSAFSNHILVTPAADGSFDDVALKEGLLAGRLYGAFEMLGAPVGFDAHVDDGATVVEMGGTAAVGSTLTVVAPTIAGLDRSRAAPLLTLRVLRAVDSAAGFEEVQSTTASPLSVTLDAPGVYRAEVRMVPLHLRAELRDDGYAVFAPGRDFVWVYSNPFYVQ